MVDLGLQCTSSGFPTALFSSVWLGELSNGRLPIGLGNGSSSYSQMRSVMTKVLTHTENQRSGALGSLLSSWDLSSTISILTCPLFPGRDSRGVDPT